MTLVLREARPKSRCSLARPLGVLISPAAAAIVALAVRLAFLRLANIPLESDEAIVGLMARHILYRGEWPTFYYGQNYLGPLEPVSSALVMAVLGPTVVALRLAPIAYSVVFVGLTISFARRAFGPSASFFTGFYLALPPLFLLTWSVKARGGYAELLALGAWILWLTLDLGERRDGHCGWVALGGVVGLALWTDPLAVVYVVPAALYLALRCRRHLLRWTTGAAVGAAALTSYPMLRANLQSGGATLRDLAGANASQPLTAELFRHNLSGVGQTSLSVLLGFLQASSNVTGFAAAASAHRIAALAGAAVGVTLLLALVALGLWSIPRVLRLAPEPFDLLAWVGLMAVALSASSQIESLHLTEPRYLLPLYALAPLGGALAQRVEKTRPGRSAMLAALVLVLAMNVRSWVRYTPALAAPVLSGQVVRADDPALSRLLAERGDHAIYADYWIVYSVAFVSKEQVVGGVIDDDLRVGFNRYIPFAIAADQSPDPALVVVAGSPAETKLRAWLAGVSARYVVTASGNLHVYDRLAPLPCYSPPH